MNHFLQISKNLNPNFMSTVNSSDTSGSEFEFPQNTTIIPQRCKTILETNLNPNVIWIVNNS